MITNIDIAKIIPHAGAMCLLDGVIDWDATKIHCVSRTHRNQDNPLRISGQLPTVCGIEYAAQAMAVHGGLVHIIEKKPRTGYLASVRDVVCSCERLDDFEGDLNIHAEQLMGDESRVIYQFVLRIDELDILSGRATVVLDIDIHKDIQ